MIGFIVLAGGFFILIMFLISVIQEKLFLPQEYLMWIFKYPYSRLVFIYLFYITFGFTYIFNIDSGLFTKWIINVIKGFVIRHRILFISTFVTLNIVLMYTIIFNVTVITNDKIINHTFLSPQGKEYRYEDIVKIDTGIYGKKLYLPFTHSKGDFYYIIQLNDGTKIDLAELGGTKTYDDFRFILEKLDRQYVNMGISKVSSMDNFEHCTPTLAKIYTDKIQNILLNIK